VHNAGTGQADRGKGPEKTETPEPDAGYADYIELEGSKRKKWLCIVSDQSHFFVTLLKE
jgi:hypothetical protein